MDRLKVVRDVGAEALVDLARYPVTDLNSEQGRALVTVCREAMQTDNACVLKGFIKPTAVTAALTELTPQLGDAYYCEKGHNPYLDKDDPAYPQTHPRNRQQHSDVGCLADDQIGDTAVLRTLYRWPVLQAFVAAVLGEERLYPYADPLGSLNLNVFQPGQQLGWHYDNADWVVTLMLQPAQAGGVYEYVPGIRRPDDENFEQVAQVLDGTHGGVRQLDMDAGALILFRGRYTIHRVTRVQGRMPRLVAVFSYDTQPGVMLTEHNRRLFYGRVA